MIYSTYNIIFTDSIFTESQIYKIRLLKMFVIDIVQRKFTGVVDQDFRIGDIWLFSMNLTVHAIHEIFCADLRMTNYAFLVSVSRGFFLKYGSSTEPLSLP